MLAAAAIGLALTLTVPPEAGAALGPERLLLVQGVIVVLGLLPLVFALTLRQQREQVREALSQFSDDLGSGDWQGAVQALRHEPQGPPSAFDALATGVAGVMGETDRRWQALADLSADWYWETDSGHAISRLFGSTAVFTSLGWQPDDLLGRRHDQIGFFRLSDAQDWGALNATFEAQSPFRDVEFEIVSADRRSLRWVTISGRPRRDVRDEFAGYEGVGRDITERKRSLVRLQASEQRWAAMVGLASDWYWETDASHRVQPLADEVRRRLPSAVAAAEGSTWWETWPGAADEARWQALRGELEARRPFRSLELSLPGGDREPAWISLSGVPRTAGSGAHLGYHGVGRDITVRKRAEYVLRRHNETLQRAVALRTRELEAVNRDLDAFARQLAHELRTPIGQMQGLAQLLQSRAATRLVEEDHRVLQMQLRAAASMKDTVEALLLLARSTLQPLERETVDLSALTLEVSAGLSSAAERQVPLEWEIEPGILVTGSAAALRIVLVNLLGNAVKFTRQAAAPRIRVTAARPDEGWVRVAVQDNGAGFPPEQAERLFQPFSRLHDAQHYAGTGIGLTIVQRIVERHGGTVSASSHPGEGACFQFTLPAAAIGEGGGAPPPSPLAQLGAKSGDGLAVELTDA